MEFSREIDDLNNILRQLDLFDIYKTCHATRAEYIFFSSANVTLHNIVHIDNIDQETNLLRQMIF